MGEVRQRAIAAHHEAIQRNVARIEEGKRAAPPNALQVMSSRLNVSVSTLQSTLRNTVFKGANDSEFAALIVVSNAYNLNPLLKEIYAFAAKGGGIIPYVSIDGWTRIMNEHPQFDGIEFNDIVDEENELYAIEAVIYRKDRGRPIKVTEYMDECKGTSAAWQKTPKRMLRHRSLMQGARIAFGFSGIYGDGDVEVMQDGGEGARPINATVPTNAELISHDQTTGEIYDEQPGEITEEAARAADRDGFAQMDGRDDRDMGEANNGTDETHPARGIADDLIARCDDANVMGDVVMAEQDFAKHRAAMPDEMVADVEAAIGRAKARFQQGGK